MHRKIIEKALSDSSPKVAVLGATGMVGQTFVWLLANHPTFKLQHVCASHKHVGMAYLDAAPWLLPVPAPRHVAELTISAVDAEALERSGIRIVFSALPSSVARGVEDDLRKRGFWVFSNASAMRTETDVPILVPEANPEAIEQIRAQGFPEKGFVVTNPNCATAGLAVALAPLRQFDIEEIFVSTYQSVSGAGLPGPAHVSISGNAIPHIPNEEPKIVQELSEILSIEAPIFPTCVRIDTLWGHLETVWVKFRKDVGAQDVLAAWARSNPHTNAGCPSSAIVYDPSPDAPQPRNSMAGSPPGMPVQIGRLRQHHDRFGFVLLVHNLVKGAAGGSIQNAELFLNRFGGHPCAVS